MIVRTRQLGALALAAVALLLGCKKKQNTAPSPQAQAPATTAAPPPAVSPAQVPPQTTASPTLPQTLPEVTPPAKTAAKPKNPKHRVGNKPESEASTPAPASQNPHESGSPPEGEQQISVGMSQGEAARQRQAAEQLLGETDAGLKGMQRTLSAEEQVMVAQITSYMAQARDAINGNDLVRANNLAQKAHLLFLALAKQ